MVPRDWLRRALSTVRAKLIIPYDVLSPLPSPQADTTRYVLFSEVITDVCHEETKRSRGLTVRSVSNLRWRSRDRDRGEGWVTPLCIATHIGSCHAHPGRSVVNSELSKPSFYAGTYKVRGGSLLFLQDFRMWCSHSSAGPNSVLGSTLKYTKIWACYSDTFPDSVRRF